MDPFQALAKTILGIWEGKKIQQWAILLFEIALSGILGFLLACGGCLVSGTRVSLAIGSGMISAAVGMLLVFQRSPLTKGMLLVIPKLDEAAQQLAHTGQTVQR